MYTTALLAALASILPLTLAAPLTQRQSSTFGLSISGGRFDLNQLQTLRLSYANSSAYLGEIKYQEYSEPLVVSGGSGGLTFQSIHQAPTGEQEMYVVPGETQPVGFSVPHGGAPPGVSTTGFSFGPLGNLNWEGKNKFWACQNAEQAELNSWQVWWAGAGEPNGVSCRGPIGIKESDGCART